MSTGIWTAGEVLASIAATHCDRCGTRNVPCVELMLASENERVRICMRSCFLQLAHAVGAVAGDYLRAAMAAGLRGNPPPLPLDATSPFMDGEQIAGPPCDHLVLHKVKKPNVQYWCSACRRCVWIP